MSHEILPLGVGRASDVDRVDTDLDQILAMAVLPLGVVLAAFLLEHDDLAAAGLAEDRGQHRSSRNDRGSDLGLIAADHEHFAERDLVLIGRAEHVAPAPLELPLPYPLLLSTGPNHAAHTTSP